MMVNKTTSFKKKGKWKKGNFKKNNKQVAAQEKFPFFFPLPFFLKLVVLLTINT